jgi:hypothetical protein
MIDRLEGFDKLGGIDDFKTTTLEAYLVKKEILSSTKIADEQNDSGSDDDDD